MPQQDVRAPDAAGNDHRRGSTGTRGGCQLRDPSARGFERKDLVVLEDEAAMRVQGVRQRRDQAARIDLMIAFAEYTGRDRGA